MADEIVKIADIQGRISARRLRIDRRQKEVKGILPEITESVNPPRKSVLQCSTSDQQLRKVVGDTCCLVVNVKNAAVSYEKERKCLSLSLSKKRIDTLEQEGQVGAEHVRDIARKWRDMFSISVPSDLNHKLSEQRSSCEAVVNEKDKLIQDLKNEIDEKEKQYGEGIIRQETEIQMTIDRSRDQISFLDRRYNEELNSIEMALVEEWKELHNLHENQWKVALSEMKSKTEKSLDSIGQLIGKWELELEDLARKKSEELSEIRDDLDKDVHEFELLLQDLKTDQRLNEEKLEYGYQVLRKRNEEQIFVKANQKRKLTKMKDSVTELRSNVGKLIYNKRKTIEHIHRDCDDIKGRILNQERKSRLFQAIEIEKIDELWRLNDETARKLIEEISEVDKQIHENILNVSWETLDMSFLLDPHAENYTSSSLVKSAPIYSKPLRCVSLFRIGLFATKRRFHLQRLMSAANKDVIDRVPREARWNILQTLADRASYLIEKQLERTIDTLPPDDQIIMKLDIIFSVLNIRKELEVEQLIEYVFEKCYVSDGEEENGISGEDESALKGASSRLELNILRVVNEFLLRKDKLKSQRQFVQRRNATAIPVKTNWEWKCKDYWMQFLKVFPASRMELWNAVFSGLAKLRKVKLERYNLCRDIKELREHNNELKGLLSNYLRSRKIQSYKHG